MRKMLLILVAILAITIPSFAQPSNNFSFFPQDTSFAAASTGNTVTLCAALTGITVNNFTTIDHTKTTNFIFKFGTGFGVLDSASNVTVTHYPNTTASLTPVSVGDFTLTAQLIPGKIILTYNQTVDEQFAFLDNICVDANWDAPVSAAQGLVTLAATVNSVNPGNVDQQTFFVR